MALDSIEQLQPAPYNPRRMGDAAASGLAESIDRFGDIAGIVWNEKTGHLVCGHQRVEQLRKLGGQMFKVAGGAREIRVGKTGERFAVRVVSWTEAQEKAANVAANNPHIGGEFTDELQTLLGEVQASLGDEAFGALKLDALLGAEDPYAGTGDTGSLAEDFGVPPFSVLDARAGYWASRKEEWLAWLDLNTAAGREYILDTSCRGRAGRVARQAGGSAFDPVLAEVMLRWFCPPGGRVLDPFAGESVKGIVAAQLGYEYVGVELRPEQVEANNEQASRAGLSPKWVIGDSAQLADLVDGEFDFCFTSPPYASLEEYQGGAADGSAIDSFDEFMGWHNSIMLSAAGMLRPGRFVATKISTVRDKSGAQRPMAASMVDAMRRGGHELYNECVLLTKLGSVPLKARRYFKNRKLVRAHEDVLVFAVGGIKAVLAEVRGWPEVAVADEPDAA